MKFYAVRNLNDDFVCITNKKPNWNKTIQEWLFPNFKHYESYWNSCHVDIFKTLTGLKPPKEGKDGIIIVPNEKMKLIILL